MVLWLVNVAKGGQAVSATIAIVWKRRQSSEGGFKNISNLSILPSFYIA
jgi:hypothetical protein